MLSRLFLTKIYYESISFDFPDKTNFGISNFKTNSLLSTKQSHFVMKIHNAEYTKLVIRGDIKIVNFSKYLVEISLENMLKYSFSDFPDSVEKIHISRYLLNKKSGILSKNIREVCIDTFYKLSDIFIHHKILPSPNCIFKLECRNGDIMHMKYLAKHTYIDENNRYCFVY